MHPLRRKLPSLNHLYVVEAVGRHLSFTAAASELKVSQPAISKSIRALEASLGFTLFQRNHRSVSPTYKGRVFIEETQQLLNKLNTVTRALDAGESRPNIRMVFSSSFVALWLLPRLGEFKAAHPSLLLTIDESANEFEDLNMTGHDISARLGDGKWEGLDSWSMAPERISAVASPEYLARNPQLTEASDLCHATLLHATESRRRRMSWQDWLRATGCPDQTLTKDLVFSEYHATIYAALIGQGIALGWEHLVSGLIAEGRLVRVVDSIVQTDQSVYLVSPHDRIHQAHVQIFRDWILAQEK